MEERREIKLSNIIELLETGYTRSEIKEHLNLTGAEARLIFSHSSIKGRRTRDISIDIIDDTEETIPVEIADFLDSGISSPINIMGSIDIFKPIVEDAIFNHSFKINERMVAFTDEISPETELHRYSKDLEGVLTPENIKNIINTPIKTLEEVIAEESINQDDGIMEAMMTMIEDSEEEIKQSQYLMKISTPESKLEAVDELYHINKKSYFYDTYKDSVLYNSVIERLNDMDPHVDIINYMVNTLHMEQHLVQDIFFTFIGITKEEEKINTRLPDEFKITIQKSPDLLRYTPIDVDTSF